jgi:hypothetical protein
MQKKKKYRLRRVTLRNLSAAAGACGDTSNDACTNWSCDDSCCCSVYCTDGCYHTFEWECRRETDWCF